LLISCLNVSIMPSKATRSRIEDHTSYPKQDVASLSQSLSSLEREGVIADN
jgi:hypothetical protein